PPKKSTPKKSKPRGGPLDQRDTSSIKGACGRPYLFMCHRLGDYSVATMMTDDTPSAPASTEPSATTGVVSEDQVKLALRRVKDPDLQLNIIDLGLIY